MGIFDDDEEIYVASSIYNMAGPENERPDFLKGIIFGGVLAESPSLAAEIQGSYFNGPGLKQRQFYRWARDNNLRSIPDATIQNSSQIEPDLVKAEITVSPSPAGLEIQMGSAMLFDGNYSPFIEQWIIENHPERLFENWTGGYDNFNATFQVQFPNGDFFSFPNTGFYSADERYIVARYVETLSDEEGPVVEGTVTSVSALPDLTAYTQTTETPSFTPVTLQRTRTTTWSYNNGDPTTTEEDAVDADVAGQLSTTEEVWEYIQFLDGGLDVEGERRIYNFTGTDYVTNDYTDTVVTTTDLGGGVIRTETSTTTGEQVTERWDSRYDTQYLSKGRTVGGDKIFIYQVGSGNANLDGLVQDIDASGFQEFFPFLPVRLDNDSILENKFANVDNTQTEPDPARHNDPPYGNGLFTETERAYKKAFNNKSFVEIVDAVEDNEDIDDIDYAYVIFGCSLNVKENACKKYIYKFLEGLIPYQSGGSGLMMAQFDAAIEAYDTALAEYEEWEQTDWTQTYWEDIPPKPTPPVLVPPSTNTIKLKTGSNLDFDIRTRWSHIEIEQFTGTFDGDPDTEGTQVPKVDDVIIVNGPVHEWQERVTNSSGISAHIAQAQNSTSEEPVYVTKSISSIYIYWQVDDNVYRRMTVWGLEHENYIYKGESVKITAKQALNDNDESGFVIPLHYPTMSAMGIVDYTQMSTANVHMLFNSYEVVTTKWYQKGIFKVVLVIAIIVVAVVVFPGAFAAGGGILGGNLAVGAALGLAGTAALVAGVVANYVASIVIAQLLSVVGTALFGEKWGAVFAAVAGFALSMGLSGTNLFSAEGLLGLGNAVANGYAGWVQGDIAEMQEDLEDDREDYEKQMEKIQDLIDDLGGNNLNFNPLFLTDSRYGNGRNRGGSGSFLPETVDEYIGRTTMTGTDVVELTQSMVYNFVDVQKTLPRN